MRAPDSWLRSYCDPKLSVEELADELAMHSIEVERITHAGAPDPEGFVVGKVLSVEKHPGRRQAERLRGRRRGRRADHRLRRSERRRRTDGARSRCPAR